MNVLVTGGAGYLGSILAEALLAAGHSVTVLDNLMYGQHTLFHLCANPRFDFVRVRKCETHLTQPIERIERFLFCRSRLSPSSGGLGHFRILPSLQHQHDTSLPSVRSMV